MIHHQLAQSCSLRISLVSGVGVLLALPASAVCGCLAAFLTCYQLAMERGRLSVLRRWIAGLYGCGVGGGNSGKHGIFVLSICLCLGYFLVEGSRAEDVERERFGVIGQSGRCL